MSGTMQNEGKQLRKESGPGKFEGEPRITRFLWDLMSESGPDEETGDSTEGPYWAGLLKGPLAAGIEEKLSPPEREFLDREAGVILIEGPTGLVYGLYYKSKEELEMAWNDAVEDTTEPEEEVEENPAGEQPYDKVRELYNHLAEYLAKFYEPKAKAPSDAAPGFIHDQAEKIGMGDELTALFLIGYVNTPEAIEYAKETLGYKYAIGDLLFALEGQPFDEVRELYNYLAQHYAPEEDPFDVPPSLIHYEAEKIGMGDKLTALFLIGYVNTREAVEYAKETLGYKYAIDDLLDALVPGSPKVEENMSANASEPTEQSREIAMGVRTDLRGADLPGVYLPGADLHEKDLHNANLRGADLRGADLHGAVLSYADLHGAELHKANLHNANLRDADLSNADLRGADLRYVVLQDAHLQFADLRDAGLHEADLRDADLRSADLSNADLHGANLRGADLSNADLRGADLRDADLNRANLCGAVFDGAWVSVGGFGFGGVSVQVAHVK